MPIAELGNRTPFEAANAPNLQRLARSGRVGCAVTTPPGYTAGSDVCSMSLLGYNPVQYHTGRAPLEAAALGIPLTASDWIFRVNLVTVGDAQGTPELAGRMIDHSAGAIPAEEAREIVKDLLAYWKGKLGTRADCLRLWPGVSYRNILVDGGDSSSKRDYSQVITEPPHEIPRGLIEEHRPRPAKRADDANRAGAELINRLMDLSAEFLPSHPINQRRIARGQRAANMTWIWGQGTKPAMPSFEERFGLRGAMLTAVDLLAGIAALMGWDRIDVPGMTSYHDTDYAAQGRATCEALDRYDIVCSHVESPDEASHQGDWRTKLATIESIDRYVLAPVLEKLATYGDPEKDPKAQGWRLLFMPDHYTLVSTKKHDNTPPPFMIAGAWVRSAVERGYGERESLESDLRIDPGHELMEYFLRSGLIRS